MPYEAMAWLSIVEHEVVDGKTNATISRRNSSAASGK